MSAVLLGHLDAESRLAEPPVVLPLPARARLNAAAASLRVLALPGDALWTPQPLDLRALGTLPVLPIPRLLSGSLAQAAQDDDTCVAWSTVPGLPEFPGAPALSGLRGLDGLRRAPRPELDVQRRVQRRDFAHALSETLGVAPRGAGVVASIAELRAQRREAPGAFVLKPLLSAAGQGHLHFGASTVGDELRLERAFAFHGTLLFETWDEREADFGAVGWIDGAGATQLLGLHALGIDARGRFRSVLLGAAPTAAPGLRPEEAEQLLAGFASAGAALAGVGHRGPFGLDAYRRRDGSFRPLVEINARLSFGALTHVLRERLLAAEQWRAEHGLALKLAGPTSHAPADAWELVSPVAESGVRVWAEIMT